ncbi:MAG: phosphoribosylglycinamide formyltransferase [Candidatus Diapherotrites archaeon CG08_land_8_20_14_0_20_34_12]|nr:MAG: phosphoribosylglycinamide formyltransferase [Candidatus Diapherotrites archaeon CG08_land_8_20_14_0_20_34_12]
MPKKVNLAVLGSTRGTDLQAVIDAIEKKQLNAEIKIVISNKADAFILERARNHKLNAVFLDPKGKSREDYDKELIRMIEKNKVDLILLIGYMKILSKNFVDKYKNKCLNTHPSLLPAFAGGMDKNVHEEVLKSRVKETGCTLHFITEEADKGPILLQKKVPVSENETVDSLKEKVQKAEQEIILEGIRLFGENKIKIENNKTKILN